MKYTSYLRDILIMITLFIASSAKAHTTMLGYANGIIEDSVIRLTIKLPKDTNGSHSAMTHEEVAKSIQFTNNTHICRANMRHIDASEPTITRIDIYCDRSIEELHVAMPEIIKRGYQVAFNLVEPAKNNSVYVLFDQDHKNLQIYRKNDESTKAVSKATPRPTTIPATLGATTLRFIHLGMWHIYNGYDHILFVLVLILGSLGFWSLIKVVTAFTIAHSITLILATLKIFQLSPNIVEPAIALSISYVAFQDIMTNYKSTDAATKQRNYLWLIAFGFGLFHGLGFSGALSEIHIPTDYLLPSLLSFNVGVELGQLSIVALLAPVLYFIRRYTWEHLLTNALSLGIGILGIFWFVERIGIL